MVKFTRSTAETVIRSRTKRFWMAPHTPSRRRKERNSFVRSCTSMMDCIARQQLRGATDRSSTYNLSNRTDSEQASQKVVAVRETPQANSAANQLPIGLDEQAFITVHGEPDSMPKNALVGVDIGGTKTAALVSLEAPSVLDRVEFATKPAKGPEPALRLITSGIRDLLIKHRLKPAAIGVSCGGPLDHVRGVIQAPPNLSTWVDVPIKAMLEAEFGVACRLENDANGGAVAEHRFGAG